MEARKGSKLVTLHRLFYLHRGTLCNRVKSIYQSKKLGLVQLLQTRKDVGKNTKEALKVVFNESQENRVRSRKQSNRDF